MKDIPDNYIHEKEKQLKQKLKGILDTLFTHVTDPEYNFILSSKPFNKKHRINCITEKNSEKDHFTRMFCDLINRDEIIENPILYLKSTRTNFKFIANVPFSMPEEMQALTEIFLDNKFNTVEQYIHITIFHIDYRAEEPTRTFFRIKEGKDKIIVGVDNFILKRQRKNKNIEKDLEREFEITNNSQLTNFIIFINLLSLCDTPDNKRKIVELLGYREDEWDNSMNLFGKELEIFLQRDTQWLSKTYQLIQMIDF